jgi:predicted AlkP superfamily phosphohydrolase/phosphomutase
MGTPDLLGTKGTYQYFTEDGPTEPVKQQEKVVPSLIVFKNHSAEAVLSGPPNTFLRKPVPTTIKFSIHRDPQAKTAVIEIQKQRILLKEGDWSNWVELDFTFDTPFFMPDEHASGICRLYLKEFAPTFRLYVSIISINPADPAMPISEPEDFSKQISKEIGPFYTVGFKEEYDARAHGVFTDEEYATQSDMVLQTNLKLLDYALEHYDDGLLYFYFSSTDLQSHIFWWDMNEKHPFRTTEEARYYNNKIKQLYIKMDGILGNLMERYGNKATIITLSDHGFSHMKKFFDINSWLRDNGYIRPSYCTVMYPDENSSDPGIDWNQTRAYAVGLNGLYLNLEGREKHGIVKPHERESLLQELITKLQAILDVDGSVVISKVYRSGQVYSGPAMKYSPDLIIGYSRGYRMRTMSSSLISKKPFADRVGPWSADHCFAAEEIPGVLFSNRPISVETPSLVDLAPTILTEFGLEIPPSMEGINVFSM